MLNMSFSSITLNSILFVFFPSGASVFQIKIQPSPKSDAFPKKVCSIVFRKYEKGIGL